MKRNFQKHFGHSKRLVKLTPQRFQEIFDRFNKNIRKRAKLCIEQDGGHFEHLLKLKAYQQEE